MKVFVTGGSGYIGSVVVRDLLARQHEVVVFDNLERGHVDNLPANVKVVVGDLRDSVCIRDAMAAERPDAVLHFAAYALVGESMSDPMKYYSNNVKGGVNLLEAMMDAECDRLIFSSSCATYGIPLSLPIEEDMPQVPTNPYGQTKLAFEQSCEWLRKCGLLRPTYLRYFNAAGAAYGLAERHDPETHVIPTALKVALGLQSVLRVYGNDYPTPDGTCIRDYVHLKDLSSAHVLSLESGAEGAFNLGTGRGLSVMEIVEMCRQVTGQKIPVEIHPRRQGDPPALYAAGSKARSLLGWNPINSDLKTIVTDAWQAMRREKICD